MAPAFEDLMRALREREKPCQWCRRPTLEGFGVPGLCLACSRASAQGQGPKWARDARLGRQRDFPQINNKTTVDGVMREIHNLNSREGHIRKLVLDKAQLHCEKCRLPFIAGAYPWRFGLCPRAFCGPASEPPNVRHKL